MGTKTGNFSGSMGPHISYEVSFSSSLEMDDDYDYDDNLIQDYVEELIRDDGSTKGIQAFDFVMGSGWYSGAIIDGTVTWWTGNYSAEDFEATSYGNYYGACLLPDGSCTETSLEMCRALGGNFQGPGTSCYPDNNWARPRVMQAESNSGLGKGFTIGIIAGIVSGLVTTVFGTVISEILLDRLREDPELEITEEDPGTNTPPL